MKYAVLILLLVAVASAQFRKRPQKTRGGGGGGGGADGRNGNSEYNYSWRHDGGRKYSHGGAVGYCRGLGGGWAPVSIESQGENSFINNIITSQNQEYIWTGGVKKGSGWKWLSGGSFSALNWSSTGGSKRPQPDNRDRSGENCLAILNNFYRDGVKWHDVECGHTKPVICERSG